MDKYAKLRKLWKAGHDKLYQAALEMKRLQDEGETQRSIAEAIGVSQKTVARYLRALESCTTQEEFALALEGIYAAEWERRKELERERERPALPAPTPEREREIREMRERTPEVKDDLGWQTLRRIEKATLNIWAAVEGFKDDPPPSKFKADTAKEMLHKLSRLSAHMLEMLEGDKISVSFTDKELEDFQRELGIE